MIKKKKVAIVFGLTHDFSFAVASVMMDIKRFSPNMASEIVVIHNGINYKNQKLLNSNLPTRFIEYDFPIKDTSIFNQKTFVYFSKMVFSKYECLRLLEDYQNVIWLDYDIVIKKDISELLSKSETGIKMIQSPENPVRKQLHEPISDYDMDADGMCGSTFVFQDHLENYMSLYKFCYVSLRKYAKYLHFGEQAIFDFMIQEFNLKLQH